MTRSKEDYIADLVREHVGFGFTQKEAETIANTAVEAANAAGAAAASSVGNTAELHVEGTDLLALYAIRSANRLIRARSAEGFEAVSLKLHDLTVAGAAPVDPDAPVPPGATIN